MLKTLVYFNGCHYPNILRKRCITHASAWNNDIHRNMKKVEISRIALECIYTSPSVKYHHEITPKHMRIKLILQEALDMAYHVCEHGTADECLRAWEFVDEIDDSVCRADIEY